MRIILNNNLVENRLISRFGKDTLEEGRQLFYKYLKQEKLSAQHHVVNKRKVSFSFNGTTADGWMDRTLFVSALINTRDF